MVLLSSFSLGLVLCLCVATVWCQIHSVARGGGLTGSGVNEHVVGTPDTPKLTLNMYCEDDDDGDMFLNFVVYQSDLDFKFSNIGPDSGDYVEYERCNFIDVAAFLADGTVTEATYDESCGSSINFTSGGPIDDGTTLDSIRTRTFNATVYLDIDEDGTLEYCGRYYDGATDEAIYGVHCMRKEEYVKQFDYVFLVHTRVNGDDCEVFTDSYSFNVGDPPVVNITRRHKVELDIYRTDDAATRPDGPKSPDDGSPANKVSGDIETLGETLYLEACLSLPDLPTPPTSENNKGFFNDGFSPIGIYFKRCYAYPVYNPTWSRDDAVDVLVEGCGLEKSPVKWQTDEFITHYVKDDVEDFEDWLRSPNCFRTKLFEGKSFQRVDFFDFSDVRYECEVEYCLSSDIADCFGDKMTEEAGYPTCPRTKRKKREASANLTLEGYPQFIGAQIRFAPAKVEEKCSETVEFVTATSVLSTIMVILLVVASIMVYHIQSLSNSLNAVDYHGGHVVGKQNYGYH